MSASSGSQENTTNPAGSPVIHAPKGRRMPVTSTWDPPIELHIDSTVPGWST